MIFERQPRETAKAFAAFRAYLELGPERSLAAAGAKLGKSKVMMEKWSKKFDWPARAAAHGAHLALVEREAAEAAAKERGVDLAKMELPVRQEAWKEAEELIAMAREFKRRWRDTTRVPGFESVVRALELAFKLKSFAVGVPMEVKQVNTTVSGADGGPIRVELEAALDKIYGKPIPGEVVEVEEIGKQKAESRNEGQSLLTSAATEGENSEADRAAGRNSSKNSHHHQVSPS